MKPQSWSKYAPDSKVNKIKSREEKNIEDEEAKKKEQVKLKEEKKKEKKRKIAEMLEKVSK